MPQRVGSNALLSEFDLLIRRREETDAEEFNDDHEYKIKLNEVP